MSRRLIGAAFVAAAVLGTAAIAYGVGESQRSAIHVDLALAPPRQPSIRDSADVLARARQSADAVAKTQAVTMQTAIETFATDHDGSYVGATLAELERVEPTLNENASAAAQETTELSATGYTVQSESGATRDVFTITNREGAITRSCWPENACPRGNW